MLFTTANGSYIKPPKTWKGTNQTQRASIPAWSRPYINNAPAGIQNVVLGPPRKPNPQKTWRKQLIPRAVDGISAASYSIQSDIPGANVHLGVDENGDPINCCQKNTPNNTVQEYINSQLDSHDNASTLKHLDLNTPLIKAILDVNQGKKFCCNPEANRIRSAMNTVPINPTIVDGGEILYKTYSFSSREYLRSKTRNYKQNLSGSKIDNVEYAKTKGCCVEPLPYDDKNAERNALNCPPETCDGKGRKIIVKPNNQQYFQQGAVDSSSRIARLKYNTVNNNAQSYKKKFGDEAVSATQYTASGNTPFFIKSITQQPQCPKPAYRPEAFTVCSITNPADTYRQNKTTQVVYRQEKAHKLFHK